MTERITLIPGWPASRFQLIGFIGLWVGFAGLGLAFAAPYAGLPTWLVVLLWALTVMGMATMVVFLTLGYRTGQREYAAGYATAFRPVNLEVPQVDPATGLIIRQGGTELLSWPVQYNAAKRQAILKADS